MILFIWDKLPVLVVVVKKMLKVTIKIVRNTDKLVGASSTY